MADQWEYPKVEQWVGRWAELTVGHLELLWAVLWADSMVTLSVELTVVRWAVQTADQMAR